ncbi:ABC transporter ATP-binding protein [Achromobacter sp. NPDC058515]|uniref:ABC transporter ATP-binding protein n=1 Tax=Achromobacter sp. NPDC058515 TaxID=3346533 RepID=UPI00364D1D61
MVAVALRNVVKQYKMGQARIHALAQIDLSVRRSRFTVLAGRSGSGKTTLLNLMGGIDRPDSGKIFIANQDLSTLSDNELTDFRARNIGFIFQNFNLIPVLTAYENVEYPLIIRQAPRARRRAQVLSALDSVGLADKAAHMPGQLSGGQRQRVAIARALIHQPQIVLADEPTANLDSVTGQAILELLRKLQLERGLSVIFSSHDPQVIAAADEVHIVSDGLVNAAIANAGASPQGGSMERLQGV